jgi:hypothetical protein
MLRYLFLLLAVLWFIPRLLRLLRGPDRGTRRGPDRVDGPGTGPRRTGRKEQRLRNLTQQDISDAEFEEIPPEE